MKESTFRAALVKAFHRGYPKGFIWVSDVHFKSGYPDLTIVWERRHVYFELKVEKKYPVEKLFSPFSKIQLHTAKEIRRAGGSVFGLVLDLTEGRVWKLPIGNPHPPRYIENWDYLAFLRAWQFNFSIFL